MHEDMHAQLNAYLDGELHGTRLLEMKLHLASCEACQNELKELRLVSDPVTGCSHTGIYARRTFCIQPGSEPAAPHSGRPAPEARLTGLVAYSGRITGCLVPGPDTFTLTGAVTAAQTAGLLGHALTSAGWRRAADESGSQP